MQRPTRGDRITKRHSSLRRRRPPAAHIRLTAMASGPAGGNCRRAAIATHCPPRGHKRSIRARVEPRRATSRFRVRCGACPRASRPQPRWTRAGSLAYLRTECRSPMKRASRISRPHTSLRTTSPRPRHSTGGCLLWATSKEGSSKSPLEAATTVRTKGLLRRLQNDNGSVERNSPANLPIFVTVQFPVLRRARGAADRGRER